MSGNIEGLGETTHCFPCGQSVRVSLYEIIHSSPHGRKELNKLTSLPTCGFIAQFVEHRTGITEFTGSNPVEALIFQASPFQLLKLEN